MGAKENKAALERGLEALSNGDLEGWFAIHDPSVTAYGLGPEPLDFEGMKEFYGNFHAAFPDAQATIEDQVAEGDAVAFRFTFRGTHRGEFMGVAPTGKQVTVGGQGLYRFRGGKVIERWSNVDALGLMVQLGAVPAPASA